MSRNILIVDDEPIQAKMLSKFIKDMNHNVLVMNSGKQVVDFFLKRKTSVSQLMPYEIDVMLLDMTMPEMSGIDVLKKISHVKGDLQIIVLTATSDINLAINAINLGAVDYIVKGEKDVFARVIASINNAVEKRNLKYQVSNLERKSKDQVVLSDIIGSSQKVLEAINLAKKVTNSSIPVFIEGKSGTGKELLARAIHGSGSRSGRPFITVDCSLLNINNASEILYGYEKKENEVITSRAIGKLREAENGTLFLDNISELKLDVQVKFLRFLQEGQFSPVGSKSIYKINARIISSCDKNLENLVKKKKFREDLSYRLNIFPIKLPSLINRGASDIKALADSFCYNSSVNENKKIKGINDSALKLLINYQWEDNVRQLKNYIFRAVILCDDEYLEDKHFPQIMSKLNSDQASDIKLPNNINKNDNIRNSETFDIFDENGKCKSLESIECEIVHRLHHLYEGNLSEVSKKLNVSRSTVYRKLETAIKNLKEN